MKRLPILAGLLAFVLAGAFSGSSTLRAQTVAARPADAVTALRPPTAVLAAAALAVPSPNQTQPNQTQPDQARADRAQPAASHASGEEQSSEVDTTVYRHSSTVRAIARFSHLDPETVAEIFEYSNFAILAIFVLILLLKYLPKMLRERRRRLQQQLADARKATEEARERLQAVEKQFARLDEEIAQIRAQAEQDTSAEEARVKDLIEAERQRIVAAAEQEIRAAVAAARRDLKHFAGGLAVDRAERMISLTEEGDQALLRELAGRLGSQTHNGDGHK